MGNVGDESVRRVAAAAWALRWDVEREASARFERLAARLAAVAAAPPLVDLAADAARDELRHAELCGELATVLGAAVDAAQPVAPPAEIAPRELGERERVLYEVVAACCVAETESLATLTTLLDAPATPGVRAVLRELAADEVRHGRLGWAHLAAERSRGDTSFLAPYLPAMLRGNAPADLFDRADGAADDERLLTMGVLPRGAKRAVFVRTLEAVVFPGLEQHGVDAGTGRAWLAAQARATPR